MSDDWDDKTDPECVFDGIERTVAEPSWSERAAFGEFLKAAVAEAIAQPAPSPPLPEVGSRWRAKATHAEWQVVGVADGRVNMLYDGRLEHSLSVSKFLDICEPIPPAPAAEPSGICEDDERVLREMTENHVAQRQTRHLSPSCLCADDGPGHWDARCPLFEASGACVCGEPGRAGSVHRKDGPCYQRACVCLSRDCGECGPKLLREEMAATVRQQQAMPPWAKILEEAFRKAGSKH